MSGEEMAGFLNWFFKFRGLWFFGAFDLLIRGSADLMERWSHDVNGNLRFGIHY
jgi:hypothetical protein